MTRQAVHLSGLPYFPGIAVARLQPGVRWEGPKPILLITQDELASLADAPAGIIVVDAVPFSHRMIGLLSLGVPTVLVSTQQAAQLEQDMLLRMDGRSGLISDDTESCPTELVMPAPATGRPVGMADAEPVSLCASVRQATSASRARTLGATAIGLVRSEFLLPPDDQLPDKQFYIQAFGDICTAAAPLSVTFRLLDVAADKIPSWFPHLDSVGQSLGLQGVRLYAYEPVKSVIDGQLAALAELSQDFPLRILLPFLVRLEEYDYWLHVVRRVVPEAIPVGAMAETPAMLLEMAALLNHAGFVAIGCNDLMQSLYAADRDRVQVRHYLDPYAPVLFRLFGQVAAQAGEHLRQIQLCGVLSQVQGVLPVLLGLGYRSFSVDAPFIPYLAQTISQLTQAECEALAMQVYNAGTTREVLNILQLPADRHEPFLY